jgi:hypothetical protein
MKRLVLTLVFSGFSILASGLPTLAADTCSAMQNTCAARCKQRLPDDKNCVSDHCTPKLQECRKTGCWQEGRLYGGALTCNLVKR